MLRCHREHRLRGTNSQPAHRRWTELRVTPARDVQRVGLHVYGLRILRVAVNGTPATYEHRAAAPREELPSSVAGGAAKQLAAVGEAAYYAYERILQREREPELVISLEGVPPAEQPAAEGRAATPPPAAAGGATPLRPGQQAAAATSAAAPAGTHVLRIEFECAQRPPACGVHFAAAAGGGARYAATANQVRRASAWLPCVDAPLAEVAFELHLTVRADEVSEQLGGSVCGSVLAQGLHGVC